MIYQPSTTGVMWDTWMYYFENKHYLYMLHRTDGGTLDGISLAISEDGVHFEEVGSILDKRPEAAWMGTGSIWRAGGKFIMNFSEEKQGIQTIYFAQSADLIHWEILGDGLRSEPDPRWYDNTRSGRWDCIWTLPKPGGGFWGYLTATPWRTHRGMRCESIGMVESEDGLHWHALAPPVIDWGDWPRMNLSEVGAIEQIGEHFRLMLGFVEGGCLGERQVCDPLKARIAGMYSFISDSPLGPFRPDQEAYRLLVSKGTYFSRFYTTPEGIFVNHHSITCTGEARNVWMAPLKEVMIDEDGHLRLNYWSGNDRLKGEPIAVQLANARRVYPSDDIAGWEFSSDRIVAGEPYRGGVIILDNAFDLDQGIILEGTLAIHEAPKSWGGIGFCFVHGEDRGTGIMMETRGKTEIAAMEGLTAGSFCPNETVDWAIEPGRPYFFRLLARRSMIELYMDERLVQCCSLPENPTGKIGLIFESGKAIFANLQAWEMNLHGKRIFETMEVGS